MEATHSPNGNSSFEPFKTSNGAVQVSLPVEFIEAVALRVTELLAEQSAPVVEEGYLDVKGAAEFLACGTSRIYSLVSTGRIPVHRDGSRLLFDRSELRAYVAAGGAKRP